MTPFNQTTADSGKTWASFNNKTTRIIKASQKAQLPALSNGDSAMPSNADNFHGQVNASVNPRTGAASFSMKVASTIYDSGQGVRNLVLSYSGGYSAHGPDLLGLGPHWTFNIGTERPSVSEVAGRQTTDITTSDGHGFTMVSTHSSTGQKIWHLLRHKLGDVTITGQPGDWTIAMATGIREHLLNGYEDWEQSRDGQRVWLYYDRTGPLDLTRRLLYICNHPLTQKQISSAQNVCANEGIRLTYRGNDITVQAHEITTRLHLKASEGERMLDYISVPALSSKTKNINQTPANANSEAQIRFSYDTMGGRPWLLRRVEEPSGQATVFLYNFESDSAQLSNLKSEHLKLGNLKSDKHSQQSQGLPTGINNSHIPVVTEQMILPAPAVKNAISVSRTWYRYSADPTDTHNFTGYLSGVSSVPGKDNLLDRKSNYTYTVVQDNGLTSTTITYNKYHLPLTVVKTDDLRHSLIAHITSDYSPWKQTNFGDLPSTYSFPKQTKHVLYTLTKDGQDPQVLPAKVINKKLYNSNGQVIWKQDAYGRQTFTQFCPPKGDVHCPAMDPSWPQVTFPEKILTIPATPKYTRGKPSIYIAKSDDQLPVKEIVFDYKLIPVARHYHDRIKQYRQILQQQWSQNKKAWQKHYKSLSSHRLIDTLNLFSHSRFSHTVGDDNSPLAGNWQIIYRKTGSMPFSSVARLKPGDILPELNTSELNSSASFQYNMQQNNLAYGELSAMTVTKYNPPLPTVDGRTIQMNSHAGGASFWRTMSAGFTQNESFTITHHFNTKNNTRTTNVEIAPGNTLTNISQAGSFLRAGDSGLTLGTSVYSLSNGVKLSTDDTLKTLHTDWTYDNWQRPVKEVITPETGGKPQIIRWTYIINPQEQSLIRTLPSGIQQKLIYANGGKQALILSVWHRDKRMSALSMKGTANWIQDSKKTYTSAGKLASETVYHAADNNGKTIALTTTYGYDDLNRRVWTKSPDSTVSVQVRNDPDMLLITYKTGSSLISGKQKLYPLLSVVKFNIIGKPVDQYVFSLNPQEKVEGEFVYSPRIKALLMSLESQLMPVKSLKNSHSYGLLPLASNGNSAGLFDFVKAAIGSGTWITKTSMIYDGNGRKIEQTQPNGAMTHWQWQKNNLMAVITPDGSLLHDTYDVQGNKTARCVEPKGQSICHVLGTRAFNAAGNLIWKMDEYGHKITYTYDADGRMLSMNTPASGRQKGHVITYTYNSYAKTSTAIDGITYATYHYNRNTWRLTDAEDAIGHLHYDYNDNTGQLVKITRSNPVTIKPVAGIDYPQGQETFSYDRYGSLISFSDFSGNTYSATHDRFSRILQIRVTLPGHTQSVLLSSTVYSEYYNRPVSTMNGIGVISHFTYDSLGKLATVTVQQGKKIVQQLSYFYDMKTGDIISFTRSDGKNTAIETYTYDKDTNSLTAMTCTTTGKPNTSTTLCPHDTDLSGSSLSTPAIITSQKYKFDDWNNIKTMKETLVTNDGKQIHKKTEYSYAGQSVNGHKADNDNYDPHRMLSYTTTWDDNVSNFSARPQTITYDNFGRIVKDSQGNTLHYDAFSRLDRFTNVQTHEHTVYTYDSNGHQIAEQSFDAQNRAIQNPLYLIYQGDKIIGQVQSDQSNNVHFTSELQGIAHSENGKITSWYIYDHKGDVLATLDALGHKTSEHVYSPYGMEDDLLSKSTQATLQQLNQTTHVSLWQHHTLGFDGQMSDPVTGYQFLGGGYRAYNPVYRHFMSTDSYSPFKAIDSYGFSNNNPIMNTDPSGHIPFIAYFFSALSIGLTLVSALLLPICSAALGTAAGAAGLGFAENAGVSMFIGAPVTFVGIISGTTQVSSLSSPKNTSARTMSDIFQALQGVSMIVFGGWTYATIAMATEGAVTLGAATYKAVMVGSLLGIAVGATSTFTTAFNISADYSKGHDATQKKMFFSSSRYY